MTPAAGGLFADLPSDRAKEHIDRIAGSQDVRIERIVSYGQASPEGFWYDQDWSEWVIVLSGSAGLEFEGEAQPRELNPGDYVDIPAHCRHRVAWTASDTATIWMAVHYRPIEGE
jgi:cupin 2 domain-containing protein